jgi:hypothetical protein
MNNQGYLHNNSLVINSPIFTQQIPAWCFRTNSSIKVLISGWVEYVVGGLNSTGRTILEFRYISSGKEQVKLDAMTDSSFVIYNDRNLDQSQTNLANKALRLSEYFST